jgi:hypothetical protein
MTTETSTEELVTTATVQICSACEGSGAWDLWDIVPCENCNGTGLIRGDSARALPESLAPGEFQADDRGMWPFGAARPYNPRLILTT